MEDNKDIIDSFVVGSDNGYHVNSNISGSLIERSQHLKTEITRILYKNTAFLKAVKAAVPKKSTEYKVLFSRLQKSKLKRGSIELLTKKDGTTIAKLIDPKTKKFIANVPLHKVQSNPELFQSLTNYATQIQMVQIAEQVHNIKLAVDEIRQGQIDNRIALAYSCEQKYIQACSMEDSENKRNQLLQLVRDAEDARNSLMLRQKRNLDYIENQPESFWKQVFSRTTTKEIDTRTLEMKENFNAINMVSIIQPIAYQEMGEIEAARKSLIHYSNHLKQCYFNNDRLLERLDLLDSQSDQYWTKELTSIKQKLNQIQGSSKGFIKGEKT